MALVVVQLYRLCWSLRNNTEERIDLELDDWTEDQDSNSMETEGTSAQATKYIVIERSHLTIFCVQRASRGSVNRLWASVGVPSDAEDWL